MEQQCEAPTMSDVRSIEQTLTLTWGSWQERVWWGWREEGAGEKSLQRTNALVSDYSIPRVIFTTFPMIFAH
eukprot:scaffold6599_cov61-Cyclotella_meneghiniana.AAC.1